MRKVLVTTLLVAATVGSQAQVKKQSHGYPIDPVPFTSVKVTDPSGDNASTRAER